MLCSLNHLHLLNLFKSVLTSVSDPDPHGSTIHIRTDRCGSGLLQRDPTVLLVGGGVVLVVVGVGGRVVVGVGGRRQGVGGRVVVGVGGQVVVGVGGQVVVVGVGGRGREGGRVGV